MKKILRLLLMNLDKIVLALLLLLLIIALVVQVNGYMSTISLIEETKNVDTFTGKQKEAIQPFDEAQFDARVAPDPARLWKPPYTPGKWSELEPPEIFRHHTTPPANASRALRRYLTEIGPTSLFDPPVYVIPIDRKPFLLDFSSKRAYYPPFLTDYVADRDKPAVPIDEPGDDPPEGLPPLPPRSLIELVRWAPPFQPVYPNLPFILSSVIRTDPNEKETWDIAIRVNVGGRVDTRILKIGDTIENTQYKIDDADYKEVRRETREGMTITDRVITMTVSSTEAGGGQPISMTRNVVARDLNAEPSYEIVFFPLGTRTLRVKSGATFPLQYENARGTFQLEVDGVEIRIRSIAQDGSVLQERPLERYTKEAANAWQLYRRQRAERDREIQLRQNPQPTGVRPPPGGRGFDVEPGGMDVPSHDFMY